MCVDSASAASRLQGDTQAWLEAKAQEKERCDDRRHEFKITFGSSKIACHALRWGLVSPGRQLVILKCRCSRAFALYHCHVTAHCIAAVPAYAKRRCQLSAASSARTKSHCAQGDRLRATAAAEENDPGHWKYSPEWWGTQAGGWGHDSGTTVFAQSSHCGNGEVRSCYSFESAKLQTRCSSQDAM